LLVEDESIHLKTIRIMNKKKLEEILKEGCETNAGQTDYQKKINGKDISAL
jgi:hypothetical protein